MRQAGEWQVQWPDLSQGTEAVPEKQSRHIKGEAGWGRRWKAGGETRTGGRPASAPEAAGSIRSKHGYRAGVRNSAEAEEPPKRPGWGWGQVQPAAPVCDAFQ